ATVLAEIERRTGKKISELFDVIAGTSTGGFQSLLLVAPGKSGSRYTAQEIVELYFHHSKDLFHKSFWYTLKTLDGILAPKYPSASVMGVFEKYLGYAELKDAVTQVLVTCYDTDTHQLRIFTKQKAQADPKFNFQMSQAARATTALPVAFPAAEIRSVDGSAVYHVVDGGLGAMNPVVLALEDAVIVEGSRLSETLVVSLGTGEFDQPLPFQKMQGWGLWQWMRGFLLMDLLWESMAHVATLEAQRAANPDNFFRFQAALPAELFKSDLTAPKDLQALQAAGNNMLEQNKERFEKLLELLCEGNSQAAAAGSGKAAR
ncbi:MAG TPA: patatin-like phospholipase family protein, partial [Candidatus Nitrosotenuis sp.]|nr:patatin-like phospholipase family protein [Candidatus Nitrosotenuis sp.]